MLASRIYQIVSKVCPIAGVIVEREDDKASWKIEFSPEATAAEKAAALAAVDAFEPEAPTADDVREEAQRRIIALCGASDLNGCVIKQLNANMRANELNDIRHDRALTPAEAQEAADLRALAGGIKAVRAASNVLEESPPADFTDDNYWP